MCLWCFVYIFLHIFFILCNYASVADPPPTTSSASKQKKTKKHSKRKRAISSGSESGTLCVIFVSKHLQYNISVYPPNSLSWTVFFFLTEKVLHSVRRKHPQSKRRCLIVSIPRDFKRRVVSSKQLTVRLPRSILSAVPGYQREYEAGFTAVVNQGVPLEHQRSEYFCM